MNHYKILFVPASEGSSKVLQNLAKPFLDTIAAYSVERAIEILEAGNAQTLVYEPKVSRFGGFQLIEELRARRIRVPIVALTSDASVAKAIGAIGYIEPSLFFPKPA
jgi:DNA-binding NtrC family response regulator